MTETPPYIPSSPFTTYMWTQNTGDGLYTPITQPPLHERQEINARAGANIQAYRDGLRDSIYQSLEGVPNRPDINEEKINHFFHALGLPTRPLITVSGMDQLPRTQFTQVFYDSPYLNGHNFQLPGVVMVV